MRKNSCGIMKNIRHKNSVCKNFLRIVNYVGSRIENQKEETFKNL